MTTDLETKIRQVVKETEGWTEDFRCLDMAQLILDTKPSIVIEIGVFGGRTLIPMAMALKENGLGCAFGIDPYCKEAAIEGENEANVKWWTDVDIENIHRLAMQQIWKWGLDHFCILIRAASQHCSELFPSIDILNIDGCHSEVASCRDANLYLPKVRRGGHVFVDDCGWPSTQSMLKILDENCQKLKDGGHWRLYRKS